jgi:hypothetical protein
MDLITTADEDNAVPGRIATVPFDLGIGNCKTLSGLDVSAAEWDVVAGVSDDGDILIAIAPFENESILLPADRHR